MDVETIGIAVDTTGVDKGAAALDKLGTAADKASKQADGLEKKLDKTGESAASMGTKVGGLIGAGIGLTITAAIGAAAALDALINKVAKYQDLADQTGGAAEGIASMRTAADVAGVSIDSVAGAMGRMNRVLAGVDDESKGAGRAIKALGLDLDDFKKKSPDDQMREIAKALATFKDIGGNKGAIMSALTGGRGGGELLGFMKELGTETARVTYLTNEQIAAADEYADSNARARSQIMQLIEAAGALAIPAFSAFMETVWESARALVGMEKGAESLAGNTAINDFAVFAVKAFGAVVTAGEIVARMLETLYVLASGLVKAFLVLQNTETGGFGAAAASLRSLDKDLTAIQQRQFFSQKLREKLADVGTGDEALEKAKEKARNDRKVADAREAAKKTLEFSTANAKKTGAAKREPTDPLDSILKGIRARTAEMALELTAGDKLTAGQRVAVKVMEDIRTGTLKLTEAKTMLLTKEIEGMLAAENDLASKKRQATMLKAMLDEAQQNRDDIDADLDARGRAFNSAALSMHEFVKGVQDANAETEYEISLMSVSEAKREKMLAQYRLQIAYEQRLAEIDAMNIDPEQRDALKGTAKRGLTAGLDGAGADSLLKSMKELDAYFDPTKAQTFGEALKSTFGTAGNAFAQMATVMETYAQKQAELNKLKEHAIEIETAAGDAILRGDMVKGLALQAKANKANQQIERARSQSSIQGYADMAGAMKGFFAENSKGYKALEIVQAAFQVAQAASALAQGTAAAAVGVATQAQGEPYTAWARMIAMAASMASLGFALKGWSGGGSANTSAKDRQAVTGTGTVLGDAAAKSNSIDKSLKLLEESAQAGLKYQSGMLTALRSIDGSMAGLAIMLLKSSGITGNYTGPSQLGTQYKSFGWGKNVSTLVDKGLSFDWQRLSDVLQGGGVQGRTYSDIERTSSSWFGLVKKSSTNREWGELDAVIEQQFTRVIQDIVNTTRLATSGLGQSGEEFDRIMTGVSISLGEMSFLGLSGKEIEEQLSAAFSKISDDLARIALPSIEAFQRIGEGLFETVVRVAAGVETADAALDALNINSVSYAQIVNKQGDVASEIFRQSIAYHEQLTGSSAVIMQYLEGVAGGIGDLVDAYKELIGLRKAMLAVGANHWNPTELVRGAGGMEALQSGLDSYFENFFTTAEKDAARARQLNIDIAAIGESPISTTAAAFRKRLESIDLTTNAGQERFGRLVALADQFFEVAKAQESALNLSAEAQTNYAKNLRTFRNSLLTGPLSLQAPGNKTSIAESIFNSTLTKARSGDLDAQGSLTSASSNYLEALKNSATSAVEYAIGFAKVQTALTLEAVRADSIATQQLNHLSSIDSTLLSIAQAYNFALGGTPQSANSSELLLMFQTLHAAILQGNAANIAVALHTFETSKAIKELRDLQVQATI